MLRTRVILWTFALYVLFAERFVVLVKSDGRGLLPILMVVAVVVIVWYGILPLGRRGFGFLWNGDFWLYWGLYIFLSSLLPVAGVLFHGYPARTLFAVVSGGLPLLFIWVGNWIFAGSPVRLALFKGLLGFLIIIQFLLAVGQYLYVNFRVHIPLLAAQFKWDRSVQALYGERYLVAGRSIGTYVNPNSLGFWAVMAFWAAVLLIRGTRGAWYAVLSLLTLALSQSRGAMGAMAVCLGVFACTRVANMLIGNVKVRIKTVFKVLTITIAITIVSLAMPTIRQIIPGVDRVTSWTLAFLAGPGRDVNWDARLLAWREALELYRTLPWGTWGPPEFFLGQQWLDSEWVRLLLQGGVFFVSAFVLTLLGGLRYITFRGGAKSFLAVASIALAVLSVTCTPTAYPPVAIYWVCVGWCLADCRRGRGREGSGGLDVVA